MSNYIAVGVSASNLLKENVEGYDKGSGFDPFSALFDFIDKIGLNIELAITNPKVQAFMRDAGIKAEEAKIALINEQRKRKEKNNLLKWGVLAAIVGGGFLVLR